jgi:FAD/FMN-containing dehydrogenase
VTALRTQRLPLSGWGRFPIVNCAVATPRSEPEAAALYEQFASLISRGNGRSYGDAAVNAPGVLLTKRLDRMLAFDSENGILTCEAGVSLADIIAVFLPRGWFPVVTPGTRFVTVGGLIAADVHGKNHHLVGSFCHHLLWVDLLLPSGDVLRCSPDAHADLFDATCGGMGLTGTLLRAAFRLQRVETAHILQHIHHGRNLEETFEIFEHTLGRPYSVAWIDGLASGEALGRAVVFIGEHLPAALAGQGKAELQVPPPRSKRVPIDFPGFALSRLPVKLFNMAYRKAQRAGVGTLDLYRYFYPLDAVFEWNRIYGRRGFVQYQCALPLSESRTGISRLLTEIAASGDASFLSTLKRLGPSSKGYLSFPIEGYTLAMDFPASPHNLRMLDRLDQITVEHGGRLYLAKDARAAPATVVAGYPQLDRFRAVRRRYGLETRVQSHLSRRIGL